MRHEDTGNHLHQHAKHILVPKCLLVSDFSITVQHDSGETLVHGSRTKSMKYNFDILLLQKY